MDHPNQHKKKSPKARPNPADHDKDRKVTKKRRYLKQNQKRTEQRKNDEKGWEGWSDKQILSSLAFEVAAKHNLLSNFSELVESELKQVVEKDAAGTLATPEHLSLYKDLTDLDWVSIDNDDTMDIDQVNAAQQLEGGRVRLLIGVADCHYFVKQGGELDRHAVANCASIYTPAKVFTMLPKQLSYDLASLVQGEKRKAYIVDITFADAESAEIVEESVYLGIVENKAKLAYPSMSQWLKGEIDMPPALAAAPELAPTIKLQDQIARAIFRKRQQTGALELETNQPNFIWEGEEIENILVSRQNRAQKLIENLMVTANGVTSRWLVKHKSATVQRVVKEPERWDQIRALATSYGYTLPGEADSLALRAFLATRREADPVVFPDLSLTIVKLMGRGEYIFTPPGETGLGHFGLAVVDYTHSTAPNRRYPDLITQRLIAHILLNKPAPYNLEELETIAKLCTDMEAKVSKAERQLNKSACALLLRDRLHEKFDCIITGTGKGNTFLRLLSYPVEGRLMGSGQGQQVGNQIEVELVSVNVRMGFIDFVYHPPPKSQQTQPQTY